MINVCLQASLDLGQAANGTQRTILEHCMGWKKHSTLAGCYLFACPKSPALWIPPISGILKSGSNRKRTRKSPPDLLDSARRAGKRA